MTDSSHRKHQAKTNGLDLDDLTLVEGIGKVKHLWLQGIGIHTLQELAAAIAQDLQRQLDTQGHVAQLSEVERWIAQAQVLLTSAGMATTSGQKDAADLNEHDELVAPLNQSPELWQTVAAFTVEFQARIDDNENVQYRTLVRHVATDEEESWAGLGSADLQAWLRTQVSEHIPPASIGGNHPPMNADVIDPENIDHLVIPIIEELYLLQPAATGAAMGLHKPNKLFPAPLEGNRPFSVALQFGIQPQDALDQLTQVLSYNVECYARSIKSGDIIPLGEIPKTRLYPQDSSYTAYLPTTRLKKGLYRLQVFLNLEGAQALPTFLEVPILQVV